MVMGFVESTTDLFIYHQNDKLSDNNYRIMFNATVESINADKGRPLHHLGVVDMLRKQIGKEMVRKEPDPENVPPTHRTKITKAATERGHTTADNEFMVCRPSWELTIVDKKI